MIHRLRQRIAQARLPVGLLCVAVMLQGLVFGAWHIHASGDHATLATPAHMEHAEAHQSTHADAVEIESFALLKFFGSGLGLLVLVALLLVLPRAQAIRPPLATSAPGSSLLRLRPPERAPPLA
ncbi:hypothetical protein FAZ79_00860 [Guyparkeria sp. SB14A]|uniref:hypothetical protein n=1 Tax=Guyparkeria sp. SB14A TaxID=2571147 RepID=UPI00113D7707|nr:hypothetical protein [Guyparkeria sp. SB14A]TKA91887.1 hypothetical protein FAZ79_00860 [Guyparkeria sp. SB14A]